MCLLGLKPGGGEVSLLGLQMVCLLSLTASVLLVKCARWGSRWSAGEVCLLGYGWSAGEVCLLGSKWSAGEVCLLGLSRRGWNNCQRTNRLVSYVVHTTRCMAMADSIVVQHHYLAARSCRPCSSHQTNNK